MSLHWPIIRSLIRQPRRVVVTDDKRSYTGADLLIAAFHVAAAARVKCESETIGLLLPTSGAFPIAALAGWMLGKTIVPINYLLKPEEMNYVIRDCGCDTVVTVQAMLDFLGEHARACLHGPGGDAAHSTVRHIVKLDDINFRSFPDMAWPKLIDQQTLAVLLYTSGTSGKPKGVMLTHANIAANIRQIINWVDFNPSQDKMFGVLPQFHSFGLTVLSMLPLTCRIPVVYTARFVPHRIVQALREHRPTIMVAIPSMYNALLHAKGVTGDDFASLRYIVSGGEPLPQAVYAAYLERFGVTINEGYGLTETAPVTNWCRPHEARRGSVGRAIPEVEQRIVDLETGQALGPDRDGEVRMRGPNIMRGYYHLPEESAKTFDAEGFFRTGDIGRLDADGHLFITGRLKEMLIIGGENVFPREIEEVLNSHPSVKESGVVGKKDPIRGELPVAFVELREDATFDMKSLMAHCRGKLAGYKVPDEIRVLEALPRNPTGKVMRRELKKMTGEGVFGDAAPQPSGNTKTVG